MMTLLLAVVSILMLVKSADVFVDQASALAKKYKVSDYLIGFTIVAFGTSLPELISTIFGTISGHSQLVVANIIGSNITNTCMIFGLVAIFNNFVIRERDLEINIPFNLVAVAVFWGIMIVGGNTFNWVAGIWLMAIFLIMQLMSKEYNHLDHSAIKASTFRPMVFVVAMAVLIISGKVCVEQIVSLADQFKISESILGYFLLAIGTSLPELVTTWMAVKKNDGELAVGNILGSNLFNLLFVLGVSTFIRPLNMANFEIDFIFLVLITLAIYVFAKVGRKYAFSHFEGIGLMSLYILFVVFQVIRA